jgi:hemolysin III
MGWLVLVAIKPMLAAVPSGFFPWMLASGLCYSVGVIFFVVKKIPFHHGIWHLLVLSGSATYFIGIYRFFI